MLDIIWSKKCNLFFSFPYPFFFLFDGNVALVDGLNEDKIRACVLRIVHCPH